LDFKVSEAELVTQSHNVTCRKKLPAIANAGSNREEDKEMHTFTVTSGSVPRSLTVHEPRMAEGPSRTEIPPSLANARPSSRFRLLPGTSWHMMKRSSAPIVQTRLRIISAAANLFHKKGVRATHIGEISQAARVTRQQLYHHFRTKSDIAEEVVRAYLAEIKTGTSQLHHELRSWRDLKRTFAAHIELLEEFQMRRGCPLGIIGNELTEEEEAIRQDLNLVFEALKERISTFLRKEKSEARLLPSANEEQLAEFCVAAMQGAMLLGKVRRNAGAVARIFEDLSMHLGRYRVEGSRHD
jgi:TetR/AcrR family transcriptional regulator, transcriptional repressor for nem operon